MRETRPAQLAFSSGEISPLLHFRSDYQRYQSGLMICSGFLPLRQGGATRAPGTIHRGITRLSQPARRIPFVFSVDDVVDLEFTDYKMRVRRYGDLILSGGQIYEIDTPYSSLDLPNLQWAQSADVVYIVDGQKSMQKLSRFALDNWTIEPVDLRAGPFRVQNLDEDVTIQCSAATGSITLTGVGTDFTPEWVGAQILIKPTDFTNIALWTGSTVVTPGVMMRYDDNIYELVTGVNTGVNPPRHSTGTRLVDKTHNTKWRYVSDNQGIVRITSVQNALSATAEVLRTVPQPCVDDPTYRWSEGAWSDRFGYPSAVFLEGPSMWAGFTRSEPRAFWKSTSGDFLDFMPSADPDGSLAWSIGGSRSQNGGRWITEGRRGVYLGAKGEVYRGSRPNSGQAIGPTNFDLDLEATDGAHPASPIVPFGYPIYISKDARRVLEIRYSFEEDGGKPIELSLPANHLGARKFQQGVWQGSPHQYAWFRMGDGSLVALLHDPEEAVLGWARVPVAGGEVEDLIVLPDADGNDVVSMTVRRVVDGVELRFIEDQAIVWDMVDGNAPASDAVHLFCSIQQAFLEPRHTMDVPHLPNTEVYCWTDVGKFGPVMTDGTGWLELDPDRPFTKIVVGLFDDTHVLRTLNIPADAPDGSALGRYRRLNAGGGLLLHRTAAGEIRSIERDIRTGPERPSAWVPLLSPAVGDEAVQDYSGVLETEVLSGHAKEVFYEVRPDGGAPLTLAGMVPAISEAGV